MISCLGSPVFTAPPLPPAFFAPDYANPVAIASGTDVINVAAPANGWVQRSTAYTGGTWFWSTIGINNDPAPDHNMSYAAMDKATAYNLVSALLPVAEGDVIAATIGYDTAGAVSSTVLNFYPVRSV